MEALHFFHSDAHFCGATSCLVVVGVWVFRPAQRLGVESQDKQMRREADP